MTGAVAPFRWSDEARGQQYSISGRASATHDGDTGAARPSSGEATASPHLVGVRARRGWAALCGFKQRAPLSPSPPLSQLSNRHPIAAFGSLAGTKGGHIGRVLQIVAEHRFELSCAVAVDDAERGRTGQRRAI